MATTALSTRGYTVLKSSLTDIEQKRLKNELTVTPFVMLQNIGPPPSPYKIYKESQSKLYLPKYYGLQKFGVPNNIKINDGDDIDVKFVGTLRNEQIEPTRAILEACHDGQKMGGILNLTCASGKTVLAIYCICQLAKKTLIIVHKDFLLKQWRERIEEFTQGAKIGLIKGKIIDIENCDIVIASLQSLAMKDYDEETFKSFGCVIVDEAHHTGAEVFCRALGKVVFKYSIGLTATIKRKDGLTKVFIWHLGDVVYSNIKCAKEEADVVNAHIYPFYDNDPNYSKEIIMFNDNPNISRMINNICEYVPRTLFMIKIMKTILEKEPERRILIISDRRNHLTQLYNLIKTKVTDDVGYYFGGLKEEQLKESEKRKIILGTYTFVSEGFDVRGLDTLMLGSPKSDVIQTVGRILRDRPDQRKHIPLIVDIVDTFSIFGKQAKKRESYYKSQSYKIHQIEINM